MLRNSSFLSTNKIILPVLLILFLSPLHALANDQAIKDQVNKQVTQLAVMIGDQYSQEYPEGCRIRIFRNGNDSIIAVAVFTIEGMGHTNNYVQVMAVFADLSYETEAHTPRISLIDFMAVGGKGRRGIESDKIKITQIKSELIITAPTMEYGPKDAMCCPSIKSEAKFTIFPEFGGRLNEITKKGKMK